MAVVAGTTRRDSEAMRLHRKSQSRLTVCFIISTCKDGQGFHWFPQMPMAVKVSTETQCLDWTSPTSPQLPGVVHMCFPYVHSSSPSSRQLFSFYRWEDWGSGRWHVLSKFTQLVDAWPRVLVYWLIIFLHYNDLLAELICLYPLYFVVHSAQRTHTSIWSSSWLREECFILCLYTYAWKISLRSQNGPFPPIVLPPWPSNGKWKLLYSHQIMSRPQSKSSHVKRMFCLLP